MSASWDHSAAEITWEGRTPGAGSAGQNAAAASAGFSSEPLLSLLLHTSVCIYSHTYH